MSKERGQETSKSFRLPRATTYQSRHDFAARVNLPEQGLVHRHVSDPKQSTSEPRHTGDAEENNHVATTSIRHERQANQRTGEAVNTKDRGIRRPDKPTRYDNNSSSSNNLVKYWLTTAIMVILTSVFTVSILSHYFVKSPSKVHLSLRNQFKAIQQSCNQVAVALEACPPASAILSPVLTTSQGSWSQKIAEGVASDGGVSDSLLRSIKTALRNEDLARTAAGLKDLLDNAAHRNCSLRDIDAYFYLFKTNFTSVRDTIKTNMIEANQSWTGSWRRIRMDTTLRQWAMDWRKTERICAPAFEDAEKHLREGEARQVELHTRMRGFNQNIMYILNEPLQSNEFRLAGERFVAATWEYIQWHDWTYEAWIEYWARL